MKYHFQSSTFYSSATSTSHIPRFISCHGHNCGRFLDVRLRKKDFFFSLFVCISPHSDGVSNWCISNCLVQSSVYLWSGNSTREKLFCLQQPSETKGKCQQFAATGDTKVYYQYFYFNARYKRLMNDGISFNHNYE